MIHLLIPALFLVVAISACNKGEEPSTEVTRGAPIEDVDDGFFAPIRKIENDSDETPNIKGDNYNKLVGYGGIIARAKACGIDTEDEQRRVKKWIDRNTTPGTMDNQAWHVTFANMTAFWGTDTDKKDCDSILHEYTEVIPWPE